MAALSQACFVCAVSIIRLPVIAVRRVAWRYFTARSRLSDATEFFSRPELADISWRRTDVRHVFSRNAIQRTDAPGLLMA
jgi:hypothetical protein